MISELMLIVLKYTGGFIAASYGVYATLTDFRKEEKDGTKILTKKGYLGIALLVTSSVLALSVDGFKDYREHRKELAEANAKVLAAHAEAEKARIAREKEDHIIKELGTQSAGLTTISTDLGTQLDITRGVSTTLGTAVKSLDETSRTSNALLEETVNRIDSLTIEVSMTIDPITLNDKSGKSIFSTEALQLLEDDRSGKINLFDRKYDNGALVTREFRQRSALVRSTLFSKWNFFFWLDKRKSGPAAFDKYMEMAFAGENGLSNFEVNDAMLGKITFNDMHTGYRAIHVIIRYTLPPDRSTGFRQHKDLNGAKWTITLRTDPDILRVDQVDLYAGPGVFIFLKSKFLTLAASDKPVATSSHGRLTHLGRGEYSGTMTIPDNFF